MRRSRLHSRGVQILLVASVVCSMHLSTSAQTPKRIYIGSDDHTDYMWTANEATYRQAFIETIDYYLNQADQTAGNPSPHQGRFNLDGSFWIWEYEHNKPASSLNRLMNRIKDGHISVPLNPLVLTYGGMPAEAVVRAMLYAGQLERRFQFRIPIAAAMENHVHPYGLAGLWAGAGARYSWKGVCGCDSQLPFSPLTNRDQEIYWMTAPDGSRILMKWNSLMFSNNSSIGGYAEAREPFGIVDTMDSDPTYTSKFPYRVTAAFGKGWDDLKTLTADFVNAAIAKTNASRQVYVSNQIDFFQDFETTYGNQIPSVGVSYGNEWELYSASMSELSAGLKRALVKLRAAEAMASLVALKDATFLNGRQALRDKAMINFGLYFEHDWHGTGVIPRDDRRDWQRRIANEIHAYVDGLYSDGVTALGAQIQKSGAASRFYAFNPLGWTRSDVAEVPYSGPASIHVVDLATGQEVPSQLVTVSGSQRLQVLAPDVPAVGYKVFEIRGGTGQAWSPAATVTGNSVVENGFYRVTLSGRGAVTSWVDKQHANKELVQARNNFYLNDLGSGTGSIQVEGSGPVSVTLVATSSSPLAHTTRLTLVRDSRRISLENRITQNFGNVQSWQFSFNAAAPEIYHEEVGAVLRAKLVTQGGHYATRNARYDWLTLNHFADVNASDGVGVTLSNTDLYFMQLGSSTVTSLDASTPLLKVLAGGQVDGTNFGIHNQGGDSNFLQRFALQSHDAYDPVSAMRFALEHQNPLVAATVTGGSAYPETSYSLVSISDPGTLLWTLKPADDGIGSGLIVRLWNLRNTPATPSVRFVNASVEMAVRTSHIETFEENAVIQGGGLVASLAANQLRTYAIRPSAAQPPPAQPRPPTGLRIVR